jgi:hypothetical protein
MNDLKFAFRQLLKNPGFTVHSPQYRGATQVGFRTPTLENRTMLDGAATEDGPRPCSRSRSASGRTWPFQT